MQRRARTSGIAQQSTDRDRRTHQDGQADQGGAGRGLSDRESGIGAQPCGQQQATCGGSDQACREAKPQPAGLGTGELGGPKSFEWSDSGRPEQWPQRSGNGDRNAEPGDGGEPIPWHQQPELQRVGQRGSHQRSGGDAERNAQGRSREAEQQGLGEVSAQHLATGGADDPEQGELASSLSHQNREGVRDQQCAHQEGDQSAPAQHGGQPVGAGRQRTHSLVPYLGRRACLRDDLQKAPIGQRLLGCDGHRDRLRRVFQPCQQPDTDPVTRRAGRRAAELVGVDQNAQVGRRERGIDLQDRSEGDIPGRIGEPPLGGQADQREGSGRGALQGQPVAHLRGQFLGRVLGEHDLVRSDGQPSGRGCVPAERGALRGGRQHHSGAPVAEADPGVHLAEAFDREHVRSGSEGALGQGECLVALRPGALGVPQVGLDDHIGL